MTLHIECLQKEVCKMGNKDLQREERSMGEKVQRRRGSGKGMGVGKEREWEANEEMKEKLTRKSMEGKR